MSRSLLIPLASALFLSDEQAMWRVQSQEDPHAFARLMDRWRKRVYGLCARMTGDSHRAEDLTQETFTRLFVHRKSYVPTARFSTFLWRIALNLCYDELRRVQRRGECSLDDPQGETSSLGEVLVDPEPAPDERLVQRERAELVRTALLRLSETHRTALVLRHFEQLKFREIAEVLEIPEGTVKSRMAEAMTQLNHHLNLLLRKESTPCKTILNPNPPKVTQAR
ncbi:MAG: sigma-70 family RNA polymerase sigma factor [Candidatus Omnitrophica bacterium]|nr:sigma-70 family RNA polymerase sigma factor [Candidatus Omnitrophota bacterium]